MIINLTNKLADHGLELPAAAAAAGLYQPATIVGRFAFVSGQLPFLGDGSIVTGLVGGDVTIDEARVGALRCALLILAQLNKACQEHGAVFERMVSLQGFVASGPDFKDHPKVINAASELLKNVLGEAGEHTRTAVGVSSLPLGAAVEISACALVRET